MPSRLIPVLESAKTTLRTRWRQRAYATDKHGESVSVFSSQATKFCVKGALVKACHWDAALKEATENLLYSLVRPRGNYCTLEAWNDEKGRTEEEVLTLLDEAIEKEKKHDRRGKKPTPKSS